MLEVANPLAVEALLDAATAGACPRADDRRAPPVAGGVLALFGLRAPARYKPIATVVVSAHVDLGADDTRNQQGYQITLRSANDSSFAQVPPSPSQRSSICCEIFNALGGVRGIPV